MDKRLVIGVVLLMCGCSAAPQILVATQEQTTSQARTKRISTTILQTSAIESLEIDLLVSLWLHMKDEERRLQALIDDLRTPGEKRSAAEVLLPFVKEQAHETLTAMFRD